MATSGIKAAPEFIQSLVCLGLLSADEKNWLKDGAWAQAPPEGNRSDRI